MGKLGLTVARGNHDRTCAIWEGRVALEGAEVNDVCLEADAAFHRAFKSPSSTSPRSRSPAT